MVVLQLLLMYPFLNILQYLFHFTLPNIIKFFLRWFVAFLATRFAFLIAHILIFRKTTKPLDLIVRSAYALISITVLIFHIVLAINYNPVADTVLLAVFTSASIIFTTAFEVTLYVIRRKQKKKEQAHLEEEAPLEEAPLEETQSDL